MEITVIITAYNLGKYIDKCLHELEKQTYTDFDVLIVDDCSSDDTAKKIDDYISAGVIPVTMIRTPHNLGSPGLARNFALDSGLIDGRYVVFLDGDDSIEPDFLAYLHSRAEEAGADIAMCSYDRVESDSGRVLCREMVGFQPLVELPPEDDVIAFINTSLWNKLIRYDVIGDSRMRSFKVGEDMCFALELYGKSRRLAYIDRQLIHYRVSEGSIISGTDEETIWRFAGELETIYKSTEGTYHELVALIAFIHIGLSMCLRAQDNPSVKTLSHVKRTREHLKTIYDFGRSSRFMKLKSLSGRGIKGLAVWGCVQLYKAHCFPVFLLMYKIVTRVFHVDFKF